MRYWRPNASPETKGQWWGLIQTQLCDTSIQNKLPIIIIVLVCTCFGYTQAVAVCSTNNLRCFDCNSHTDPYCADPFNWTTLPPTKLCDGCCVKIVQGLDTPDWKVRRSCTENLDINMFMVDHVCMSEGGGRGKMCFCEDSECNTATTTMASPFHLIWVPIIKSLSYT